MARRQAWCPRCDEIRRARPGSACPTCSARLVALPQAARADPWRGGRAAIEQRVRSVLPALRTGIVTVVALALLAGAFVAGRSTSPAGAASEEVASAPVEGATETARPGRRDTAFRDFGWSATRGAVTISLRNVFTRRNSTMVWFEVRGLDPGWRVGGFQDLRIEDSGGRDLVGIRLDGTEMVNETRELGGGGLQTAVELPRPVDPGAVARVRVGSLMLVRDSEELLVGSLVDAQLKRRVDANPNQADSAPASCPGCRLEVRCEDCRTLRLAGSTYRRGEVVLLLAPVLQAGEAAPDQTFGRAEVAVLGSSGQFESRRAVGLSGDTVVTFAARELAGSTGVGTTKMTFRVLMQTTRALRVAGPWQIDQRSGLR